jgi:uncharacterized protein (DUF58 family)
MPATPLLDRHFLERLERLALQWNKSFPGLVGGHNVSRFAGSGQEFLDHRHFHQGDDLRAVNWRAFLRLEKMFLKMFQVEPRVPVRLLVDTSKSMTTGAGGKFDYARKLAAALCYVGLVRLDSMEIHGFNNRLGQRFFCTGGRHRFSAAMENLDAFKAEGATDSFAVVRQFLSTYPQPGLLIIISDFLDDAGCEKSLQYLADFGHELQLIQVWDEEDRVPPWTGELELEDAETGSHNKLWFDDTARARYTEAFDAYARALDVLARRNSGRYAGVSTSMPLEEVVFGALVKARGIA